MARLRLLASAREAAGTGRDVVDGETVSEVLAAAVARYGDGFAAVLSTARIWVNGEPAAAETVVAETDEVAVLPPVSGGAGGGPSAAYSVPARAPGPPRGGGAAR